MMTVDEAIERSVERNEIIHLDWSAEHAAYLGRLSDGDVRNFPTHEFWGTDDDGASWRIHLDMASAVETLRDEAATAGDEAMVESCDTMISGDWSAMGVVLRALDNAMGAVDMDAVTH